MWSIPRCLCHSRVTDGRASATEANQPGLKRASSPPVANAGGWLTNNDYQ
ncbi:MAG: hypothetical protein ACFFCS_00705 [Candidatus Hodarchaeota archaeon]